MIERPSKRKTQTNVVARRREKTLERKISLLKYP
jgi:hypothetical protein